MTKRVVEMRAASTARRSPGAAPSAPLVSPVAAPWAPKVAPPSDEGSAQAAPPRFAVSRYAVACSVRKRAFDVFAAALALLVFLPLFGMIAALIRLETPGPALFRQRRTGLDGRPFVVLKFRTMTVAEDGETVRQATRGDARVTALGAVLRRLSLDELPQLLNVLSGDMSLIGPRPHALAHDEAWRRQYPDYDLRFRARPGLTGLAAVEGFRGEVRCPGDIAGRIAADNRYIDTWSFMGDVRIVLRTLPLIFGDARAY